MYLECPHCHAIFALPDGLEKIPERVRCGECSTVFTPQAENDSETEDIYAEENSTPLGIDDFLTDTTPADKTTSEEAETTTSQATETPMDRDIMESFQSYLDGDNYPQETEPELPDLNLAAPIAVEDDPLKDFQSDDEENPASPEADSAEAGNDKILLDDESSELTSDRLEDTAEQDFSGNMQTNEAGEQPGPGLPDINEALLASDEQHAEAEEETAEEALDEATIEAREEEVSDYTARDETEDITAEDQQTVTGEFRAFIDEVDGDPLDLFSADKAESIYEQQFLELDEEADEPQTDLLAEEAHDPRDDEDAAIAELNQVIDEQESNIASVDPAADATPFRPAEDARAAVAAYQKSTWLYTLGGLFLLLTLAAQYLYFHREQFAAYPETRPLVTALCKVAGCAIAPRRDLEKIALLNHGIYSHPTRDNALIIKALIRNQADFPQPYPVIELALADLNDRKIALRRFGPGEYLSEKTAENALMPVNKNIPVQLQVVDPGPDAVAFEFEFL